MGGGEDTENVLSAKPRALKQLISTACVRVSSASF